MQSDSEFLKEYNIDEFEHPSLTADIAVFSIREEDDASYRRDPESRLSILLIKRGEHPFMNSWALPGGFIHPGETVEECALREIKEETNVTPAALMPVGVFSSIGRDPRGWIISDAFASIIGSDEVNEVGGDDAADAKWFDLTLDEKENSVYELRLKHGDIELLSTLKAGKNLFGKPQFEIVDSGNLAFDHALIIATALMTLRKEAKNVEILFDFLPERFTLSELQKTQETILNISLIAANFRRKIADFIEETDEYVTGAGHRPAKLFKRK